MPSLRNYMPELGRRGVTRIGLNGLPSIAMLELPRLRFGSFVLGMPDEFRVGLDTESGVLS